MSIVNILVIAVMTETFGATVLRAVSIVNILVIIPTALIVNILAIIPSILVGRLSFWDLVFTVTRQQIDLVCDISQHLVRSRVELALQIADLAVVALLQRANLVVVASRGAITFGLMVGYKI